MSSNDTMELTHLEGCQKRLTSELHFKELSPCDCGAEAEANLPGCTCHGRDIWTNGVPCRATCPLAQRYGA